MSNNQGRPQGHGGNSQRSRNNTRPATNHGTYGNKGVFIGILIVVLAFVNYKLFSKIITENPEVQYTSPLSKEQQEVINEADRARLAIEKDIENNFFSIKVNSDDTKSGNLILVNNDKAFAFETSPIAVAKPQPVTFYSRQSDTYSVSYPSREKLIPEAMEALNRLSEDFTAATGLSNLILVDADRNFDDQQRIYEEKGSDIATLPGHSEHHTCLAFDFDIRGGEFDGTGEYAWIAQNCHKYGYILRYPEDKTEITQISYEPWHFRYVGKEHAYYMHEHNMCLEEYIIMLASYPIDSARLSFTTDSGESYTVYSASVTGDSAEIKVPKNYPYTISGDNNGHVIISYMTSVTPQEETPLPEQTGEVPEETVAETSQQ